MKRFKMKTFAEEQKDGCWVRFEEVEREIALLRYALEKILGMIDSRHHIIDVVGVYEIAKNVLRDTKGGTDEVQKGRGENHIQAAGRHRESDEADQCRHREDPG